jgi:F-type H+-transporting ATPase subunit epsilon
MNNSFHLDILTCGRIIYSAAVISLTVPAEFGYLGVLANHAPLFARLVKGRITVKDSLKENKVFDFQGSGFIEVLKNKVTIIYKD